MRCNGAIRSVDEWQLVFPEKNPERRWPGPADCIERAREGDGQEVRNGIRTREEGVWCMVEETSLVVVINTVFIWGLFWDSYDVLRGAGYPPSLDV